MTNKKLEEESHRYKQQQFGRNYASVNHLDRQTTEDHRIQQEHSRRMRRFFADAIELKDKSEVKKLLTLKPELNPEVLGKLLWSAVLANEVDIASMLVEAGADLHVFNPSGQMRSSILHEVVKYRDSRHHQLVVLMIERGADVNARDKIGRSVLLSAISAMTSFEIIHELLKRGARIEYSLIHLAIRHPDALQLFPMLLQNDSFDAHIARCDWVAKALFCLMEFDDEDRALPIARMLLAMEFPTEAIDKRGLTLEYAVEGNKIKMVQLLIEHGFDVNKRALGFTSPLYTASSLKQSTMTELLIRAGAKVNALGEDLRLQGGRYAIHAACQSGSIENIQVLLRNGADINVRDSRGHTPFRLIKTTGLISAKHELIIRHLAILIGKGDKVNESDLMIVAKHPDMQSYFEKCSYELEMMKVKKIVNDISFFSCFVKSTNELAFLTRNCNFSKYYDERKNDFPFYREEIDYALKSAVTCRESLEDREKILCESLEMTLPYVPLERVVYCFYLGNCE